MIFRIPIAFKYKIVLAKFVRCRFHLAYYRNITKIIMSRCYSPALTRYKYQERKLHSNKGIYLPAPLRARTIPFHESDQMLSASHILHPRHIAREELSSKFNRGRAIFLSFYFFLDPQSFHQISIVINFIFFLSFVILSNLKMLPTSLHKVRDSF